MKIQNSIAIVTGAAGGIGLAVARRLITGGARAVGMVDRSPDCIAAAEALNRETATTAARGLCGDVCDPNFRAEAFASMQQADEPVRICVPAAGILRDALAVQIDRDSGAATLYDESLFRQVLEINLLHPLYWTMQMLAKIAEHRAAVGRPRWQPGDMTQGASVLIGSISSRGNRGQISYASSKSALIAAARTLNSEGMYHGVQTKIIHPGLVDTPMAAQLPDGHFETKLKPMIPLGRMITPQEIAETVAVLIENPAISGELWVDGGMMPMA